MKKKGLILLVCLALVSTLAVNGTFAQELKTVAETVSSLFKKFLDNAASIDLTQLDVDIVSTDSGGILAPSHYSKTDFKWPSDTTGVVTRTVYAENAANEDAYVRICIAVRTDMDVLKHQVVPAATTDYTVSVQTGKSIGGKTYSIYTFDYMAELAGKGESGNAPKTPEIQVQLLLTKETENEDITALGSDFLRVQSFAIESDAFVQENTQMTAIAALEAALGSISEFNPFN